MPKGHSEFAFKYWPVEGARVFWRRPASIRMAKKGVDVLREGGFHEVEIERVAELPGGGKRYWRWRRGAWRTHFWESASEVDLARW